jgi:hypothetical protein
MVVKYLADASPQKRLFISLITRDISLADAMLDLIDNSINAAIQPLASQLKSADDYQRLLATPNMKPKVHIYLRINSARIAVDDNAPGIPLEMARQHVFRFGRDEKETDPTDRLSVYGIGLKRAMFKCGNRVTITSDHKNGGFELKLPDVAAWAREKETPEKGEGSADSEGIVRWTFPITPRPPAPKSECGTRVMITELHDDILRRIDDGLFLPQLRNRIAQTYSFYLGRIIDITLNNELIKTERFDIGGNHTSQKFKIDNVSCNVTAGIALTTEERFRERNLKWTPILGPVD